MLYIKVVQDKFATIFVLSENVSILRYTILKVLKLSMSSHLILHPFINLFPQPMLDKHEEIKELSELVKVDQHCLTGVFDEIIPCSCLLSMMSIN